MKIFAFALICGSSPILRLILRSLRLLRFRASLLPGANCSFAAFRADPANIVYDRVVRFDSFFLLFAKLFVHSFKNRIR